MMSWKKEDIAMCRACGFCIGAILAALFASGCGSESSERVDTGSTQVAQNFFTALREQQWDLAYDLVHIDCKVRVGGAQFRQLAGAYRKQIGFEPESVVVRSCEESGGEAKAHIAFRGRAGTDQKFFKDAIRLKQQGEKWFVVLSSTFGQPPAKGIL